MNPDLVEIYTDGACSGNPGPGGWGAVVRRGRREQLLHGGVPGPTTCNRMELLAPIRALESLEGASVVRVHTDSRYVIDGATTWLSLWAVNGWRTTSRKPVRNVDLWRRLAEASAPHQVDWRWVRAHSGHPGNELADRLAAQGVREAFGTERPLPHRRRPSADQPRSLALFPCSTGGPSPTAAEPWSAATRPAAAARFVPDGPLQRCQATTRARTRCPVSAPARPGASGLCHVHDPARRCGTVLPNGDQCRVTSGGGPCGHPRTTAAPATSGRTSASPHSATPAASARPATPPPRPAHPGRPPPPPR